MFLTIRWHIVSRQCNKNNAYDNNIKQYDNEGWRTSSCNDAKTYKSRTINKKSLSTTNIDVNVAKSIVASVPTERELNIDSTQDFDELSDSCNDAYVPNSDSSDSDGSVVYDTDSSKEAT